MNEYNLRGVRVLVVGGTGFIGSRLAEKLACESGADVRVMVHRAAGAVRVARHPVELVHGSVLDRDSLREAADGCHIVFHCAYGSTGNVAAQRQVNVEGTQNVLDVCAAVKVARLVYVSSLSVYGRLRDGPVSEDSPRRYSGGVYGDSKLDAEKLVVKHGTRGVPVVVVQPAIVYGPFGPLYTVGILRQLEDTGVIMVDNGAGYANVVYVDDVADALIRAAVVPGIEGECFLVSGAQPVTWREFYGAHETILGVSGRAVSMTAKEARRWYTEQRRAQGLIRVAQDIVRDDEPVRNRLLATPEAQRALRVIRRMAGKRKWQSIKERYGGAAVPGGAGAAKGVLRPPAIHPIDIELSARKAVVSIEKARRMLRFEPQVSFEQGMELVAAWAKWARVSGSGHG